MAAHYPELTAAKRIVADLERQLEELKEGEPARRAESEQLGFAAIVQGDKASQKRLEALGREASDAATRRAALEGALRQANRNVVVIERRIHRAGERQRAEAALIHAKTFVEVATRLDGLAAGLAAAMADFEAAHRAVRQSGLAREDWGALRIFTSRALATAWRSDRTLAGLLDMPTQLQETSFTEFAADWSGGWRRSAQTRIAGNADADGELVIEEVSDAPAEDEPASLSDEDRALIARGAKLAAA